MHPIKPGPSASGEESTIVSLPVEIQRAIAISLERSSDISSLCRTCKDFHATLQPVLYKNLDILLPRDWVSLAFLEALLDSEAKGLQRTTSISVSLCPDFVGTRSFHPSYRQDLEVEFAKEPEDAFGQKKFQPKLLNSFVRLITKKIPQNSLVSFRWSHVTPISAATLREVLGRHELRLRDLKVHSMPRDLTTQDATTFRPNLVNLILPDLGAGHLDASSTYLLRPAIACMSHLKLGCERWLFENEIGQWSGEGLRILPNVSKSKVRAFLRSVLPPTGPGNENHSFTALPRLGSLSLIGFDFKQILDTRIIHFTDFNKLTSLSLESCYSGREYNHNGRLSLLSGKGIGHAATWTPKLRSFTLRYERADTSFFACLSQFFLAFTGLEHASILLEGPGPYQPPTDLLKNHGSTLQSLVWDHRCGNRDSLKETSYHRPVHAPHFCCAVEEIAKFCPGLVELGINIGATTDGTSYKHAECLAAMKHLKTLNIRNMPCHSRYSRCQTPAAVFQVQDAITTTVAKELLAKLGPDKSPNLDIIALGAITYRDIWTTRSQWQKINSRGREVTNHLDFSLCPRIFSINYVQNARGMLQPSTTMVAQGTAAEAEEHSSNLRIFQPYWLN